MTEQAPPAPVDPVIFEAKNRAAQCHAALVSSGNTAPQFEDALAAMAGMDAAQSITRSYSPDDLDTFLEGFAQGWAEAVESFAVKAAVTEVAEAVGAAERVEEAKA